MKIYLKSLTLAFFLFNPLFYLNAKDSQMGTSKEHLAEENLHALKKGGSITISRSSILASSYLGFGKNNTYYPSNIIDQDLKTAWCAGNKSNGIGEVIVLPSAANSDDYLEIFPGFGKSKQLFLENNRLRKVRVFTAKNVTTSNQSEKIKPTKNQIELVHLSDKEVELDDNFKFQSLDLPKPKKDDPEGERIAVGIEILSIYPGSKYKDTCISEVRFFSNRGKEPTSHLYSSGEGTILVKLLIRENDRSKLNSFWIQNKDGKRSGWLSVSEIPVAEFTNTANTFSNTHDCGPDCEPPLNPYNRYTISVPVIAGLKIFIATKEKADLFIETTYFGKLGAQPSYQLLPNFQKNQQEIFYLTESPKK